MSHKSFNRLGWEEAEFPICCENCLGNNPLMRMQKLEFGAECQVCTKPFSVFRWSPGPRLKFRKTEICQTCSKLKNCCQSCLFDLQYGLPVQVRDSVLKVKTELPQEEFNRLFYSSNMKIEPGKSAIDYSKYDEAGHVVLERLSQQRDHSKRNLPRICSFYVKGTCNRGNTCPYRHEMPKEHETFGEKRFRDRFYGINDPVANKILSKAPKLPKELVPEDQTITSIKLDCVLEKKQVENYFYAFGEIKSVVVAEDCVFVNYITRKAAELAMEKCFGGIEIKGKKIEVSWVKPKKQPEEDKEETEETEKAIPLPGKFVKYDAQDPNQRGSVQ